MGEGNGDNAVARAVEVGPDVILLDVNLGQQDGATVLAALRADARTTGIPVLFLTANVRAADVARLRALGAGVLAKPFDPLTLGAKIAAEMGWAS